MRREADVDAVDRALADLANETRSLAPVLIVGAPLRWRGALYNCAVALQGGRVLAVGATGRDLRAARDAAYAAVDRIVWPEGFCRRDIGWRALGRA